MAVNSNIFSNARRVLAVSCAAGGAQVLSSFIIENPKKEYLFCLEGAACQIFEKNLGSIRNADLKIIEKMTFPHDVILTSTSWLPNLERDALSLARDKHVKTISVLDHWANYRERFLYGAKWKRIPKDWRQYLPDEVWVCDDYAYSLAVKNGFPPEKILQIKNPYLKRIKESLKEKSEHPTRDEHIRILYISEPVVKSLSMSYRNPIRWGYSEFDIVEAVAFNIRKYQMRDIFRVRLRLHPHEDIDKYN